MKATLKAQFDQRSAAAAEQAFLRSANNWKSGHLVSPRNRYFRGFVDKKPRGTVLRLTRDWDPGNKIHHRNLGEYIGASILVHCLDGWAFLGRSIAAQLVGDTDCARHLGYYAELRAAMSILASGGIGVFDHEHVALDSNGRCVQIAWARKPGDPKRPLGIGTHMFVWEALAEWSQSTDGINSALTAVVAGGQTLNQWLGHFGYVPSSVGLITSQWITTWGFDIKKLAEDREARNLSSYRPSSFSTSRPPSIGFALDSICSLWMGSEPSADSPFASLDRQILRSSLQSAFRIANANNRSHKQAKSQFRTRIDSILSTLAPANVPGIDWATFLTAEKENSPLLSLAAGDKSPADPLHSLQVLSRAMLLLRIATGQCRRLLDGLPGSIRSSLNFWIEEVGQDRSLWTAGNSPSSYRDLWVDPAAATMEIAANKTKIHSYSELWQQNSSAASALSSSERIFLWGSLT